MLAYISVLGPNVTILWRETLGVINKKRLCIVDIVIYRQSLICRSL